jgi:hypothetical protein
MPNHPWKLQGHDTLAQNASAGNRAPTLFVMVRHSTAVEAIS